MRKLLLTLAFILASIPAYAQQATTCATRPVGDSSNACASTAFVQGAVLTTGVLYNVKSYGALGDTQTISSSAVTIGVGSNALTVVGGNFIAGSVGKAISVPGAGVGGILLNTTISGFTDATHISITTAASTALTGGAATILYGTDDTTAVQAACSAAVAAPVGGTVLFPNGTYYLNSMISCTFTGNNYANLGIIGEGVDGSILYWPNTSGIGITLHFANQAWHVRDLTIATGSNGSAGLIGLGITGDDTSPSTTKDVTGVTFRPIAGPADWWFEDVNVHGDSLINFTNVWYTAPMDATPNYGVVLSNGGGSNESVYTFFQNNWSGGNIGLAVGSYVQGVTVNQSSFGGMNTGFYVPSGAAGDIGGFSIVESAFNVQGAAVSINSAMQTLQLTSNFIVAPSSAASISLNSQVNSFNFVGNQITNFTAQSGVGMLISGGSNNGTVVGNTLSNLGTATNTDASTSNITIASNNYATNGVNYLDAGTNNIIDIASWKAFTPAPSCASGSGTWGTVTGAYKVVGPTTFITITAVLTTAGTCGGSVIFSIPNTAKTNAVLPGRENQNTGSMLQANISANGIGMQVARYDNAAVIANGDTYIISGSYQNQ